MRYYTLFAVALSLTTFAASAQTDDYMITTKGDTVKCKVSFSFSDGEAKYQLPGRKPARISIDSVSEYMNRGKKALYRAVYRDGSKELLFTRVIENGLISLYEVEVSLQGENGRPNASNIWYAGKNNDQNVSYAYGDDFFSDDIAKPKDGLAELLKDKPEVYKQYIAIKEFEIRPVRKLVRLYNTGSTKSK